MGTGASTKKHILDVAYRLFQQYGYHAVGLSEIIARSKAPKGSLYYYFPGGKEELARESIEQASLKISHDIRKSMDFSDDAKETFAAHLHDLSRRVGEEGAHFSITLLALETMHVSPELKKTCEKAFNTWIALYEEKFLSCGYSPTDAHDLAVLIEYIVDGAISFSLLYSDMSYLETAAERVKNLL